jgi:hypothetical protein
MYCVGQKCISDGRTSTRICISGVMIKNNAINIQFFKKKMFCKSYRYGNKGSYSPRIGLSIIVSQIYH